MDFLKKAVDSAEQNINAGQATQKDQTQQNSKPDEGGFLGKLSGMANNAAGGGQAGEQKEDGLDKAIDFVQEKVFKQGSQNNESAIEQAKDEQISDFIRDKYRGTTGKDFPIADK